MLLLTATPEILKAISSLPSSTLPDLQPFSTTDTTPPLPSEPGDPISHSALLYIVRTLRTSTPPSQNDYTLNTLLRGTKPYKAPPPLPTPKSPEYIALMARLREQEDARTYASYLSNSDPAKQGFLASLSTPVPVGESDEERDEDNITPSLVLNILLSVVLCAVAVFQLTKWWPDDGVRVLFALGTGLVVGVAEVGVYAAYLRKVGEARKRERRKKEVKVDLGEWGEAAEKQIAGDGAKTRRESSGAEVETQVIWGKGVHGGMRRRVREKWEKEQA